MAKEQMPKEEQLKGETQTFLQKVRQSRLNPQELISYQRAPQELPEVRRREHAIALAALREFQNIHFPDTPMSLSKSDEK